MFASIKTMVLASVIGIGALATTPASADSLTLGLSDRGLSVTVSDRDEYRRHGRGWERDYGRRRGCSEWRAVDKAERMGIRRARVVDAGYRGIVVRGHRYGDRVEVVFGNAPHCPVRGMY